MNTKKYIVVALTTACFLVGIGAVAYRLSGHACERLRCISFERQSAIRLTDVYEETPGSVFRGLYTFGPSQFLRVDVRTGVDAVAVSDYINGRIAGMKALYDNIRSPYPGLISNEISCDDGYKPTYQVFTSTSGISINQITGYLNDRMTFGACLKSQIVYKGYKVLFACPNRHMMYDMELIAPIAGFPQKQFDMMIQSLRCLP